MSILNNLSDDNLARSQLTPAQYLKDTEWNGYEPKYEFDSKTLKELEKIRLKCESDADARRIEPVFPMDPDHWTKEKKVQSNEENKISSMAKEQAIYRSHMMRIIEDRSWQEAKIPYDFDQKDKHRAVVHANKLKMAALNKLPFIEQKGAQDHEPFLTKVVYMKPSPKIKDA